MAYINIYKNAYKHLITTTILLFAFSAHAELAKKKEIKKDPCPDIQTFFTEMGSSPQVWDQVTDIRVRSASFSKAFEGHAIKKFYKSRTITKEEFPVVVSRYKQTGCEDVTEIHEDGSETQYTVTDKNSMKLVLTPKNLQINNNQQDLDKTVVFKIRRFGGHKIVEKLSHSMLTYSQGCGNKEVTESHPVEIRRIYSWKKPIQLRRIATSHLLDILNDEVIASGSGVQRKIANCE